MAASVVPGAGQGQADDKLTLPPQRLVKREERQVEGQVRLWCSVSEELEVQRSEGADEWCTNRGDHGFGPTRKARVKLKDDGVS